MSLTHVHPCVAGFAHVCDSKKSSKRPLVDQAESTNVAEHLLWAPLQLSRSKHLRDRAGTATLLMDKDNPCFQSFPSSSMLASLGALEKIRRKQGSDLVQDL